MDKKSTIYLLIIFALLAILLGVCIDAYVLKWNTEEPENPLRCERASVTTSSGVKGRRGPFCPGDIIFEDIFVVLDFDTWEHERTLAGGGNEEFQWYLNNRSNSFVENGVLNIKPTLLSSDFGDEYLFSGLLNIEGGTPDDKCTNRKFAGCERKGTQNKVLNPIKSASLRTLNSFSFKYGVVEISAKMPTGDWLWPSLRLLPKRNAYGNFPASGQINIAESRGNPGYYDVEKTHIGVEQIQTSLHFGPHLNMNAHNDTIAIRNSEMGQGFNKKFHKYRMAWTPDYIKFTVDGEQVDLIQAPSNGFWQYGQFEQQDPGANNPWKLGTKMAPFDQEFYLNINLAVGGNSGHFPDGNDYPKPWENWQENGETKFWNEKENWLHTWSLNSKESSLQIDYVKVFAL